MKLKISHFLFQRGKSTRMLEGEVPPVDTSGNQTRTCDVIEGEETQDKDIVECVEDKYHADKVKAIKRHGGRKGK